MFRVLNKKAVSLVFCLFLFTQAQARNDLLTNEAYGHDWFGKTAQTTPLPLADTNVVISEVTLDGHPAGWLFRTDQVPPVCKGKRGQIAVLVAIGTDSRIKGLAVLVHREDPAYFKRLKGTFFEQFRDQRVDGTPFSIDAVTRATLSSSAIIRDVMQGAVRVLAQPEVAAKLSSANNGG